MRVLVLAVHIPANSTIGYGYGVDEDGNEVEFTGDHRPMTYIGEAVSCGALVEVEVDDWQVLWVELPWDLHETAA